MARYRYRGDDRGFIASNPLLVTCGSLAAVAMLSCCGFCGFAAYMGKQAEQSARQDLAEADRLWDEGQKEQAANKYKSLIDRNVSAVPSESEKPRVYARVIDHEVEAGNAETAKKYIEKALDTKVDLGEVKNGEALVAEVRTKWEGKVEHDVNGLVLLVNGVEGVYDETSFTITGTVVNRRGKQVKSAKIVYTLYDMKGNKVGTAQATVQNLAAGANWSFQAVGTNTKARKYKLLELTGE